MFGQPLEAINVIIQGRSKARRPDAAPSNNLGRPSSSPDRKRRSTTMLLLLFFVFLKNTRTHRGSANVKNPRPPRRRRAVCHRESSVYTRRAYHRPEISIGDGNPTIIRSPMITSHTPYDVVIAIDFESPPPPPPARSLYATSEKNGDVSGVQHECVFGTPYNNYNIMVYTRENNYLGVNPETYKIIVVYRRTPINHRAT